MEPGLSLQYFRARNARAHNVMLPDDDQDFDFPYEGEYEADCLDDD